MRKILQEYRLCLSGKKYVFSLVLSLLYFAASFVIGIYASSYATISASGPVTDLILSNTKAYDVDGFFVFGGIALICIIIAVLLAYPKRIPFALKTLSIFIIIRSIFISLTHIGPFPTEVTFDHATAHYAIELIGKTLYKAFFSGNDLFFSGHTGLPFLMAFLFWDNKWLRYMFIILSVTFGATVLLGHLHYSIDVFAAFFITASVFNLSKIFFLHDYEDAHIVNTTSKALNTPIA